MMTLNGKENAEWRRAMHLEINALENMYCWDIVELPRDKELMRTKLVLKWKKDENRIVKQHKSRLVVCSNDDTDYHDDRFFPVPTLTIAELIVCIGLLKK